MARLITKSLAASPSFGLSRSITLRWSVRATASSSEAQPWAELEKWRGLDVDIRRSWVDGVAVSLGYGSDADSLDLPQSLESCGALVLKTADPLEKARITHAAYRAFRQGKVSRGSGATAPEIPSRLPRPPLVTPKEMPTLITTPLPKTVFLLHNLAHIELNAVDLAWDTLVRFSHLKLPDAFFGDFAHVADDESRHFSWCVQRLRALGHDYGDMPGHDLLWRTAQVSRHDVTARLALVPMSQEARGLDAGPRLVDRLVSLGDRSSAQLVRRIASEEHAHVAVGVAHFLEILRRLDEEPGPVFRGWVEHLCPDLASGRFDHVARQSVGLPLSWYDRRHWTHDVHDMAALNTLRNRLANLIDLEIDNSCHIAAVDGGG